MRTAVAILLALRFLGPSVGAETQASPGPRLAHVPQEAYIGERVTFVLRARPGLRASALLDGKPIARATSSDDGGLELSVVFRRGGRLRVQADDTAFEFVVVAPGSDVPLRLTDGFVYQDGVPAILLAEHRHPPKTDRRWQVLKVAKAVLHDRRPRASSAVLAASPPLAADELSRLPYPPGSQAGFWKQPPDVPGLYEIDRLIARVCAARGADLLLVALCVDDLARGMSLQRLRVRLEWLLQHAAARYGRVFVVLTPETADWCAEKRGAVGLAAAANGTTYLPTRATGSAAECLPEALELLRRRVRF